MKTREQILKAIEILEYVDNPNATLRATHNALNWCLGIDTVGQVMLNAQLELIEEAERRSVFIDARSVS